MILSGVLVKFDQLNPTITSQSHVPIVGEMMTARWAYEALAVHQFKDNAYEKNFFEADKVKENVFYQKDYWLSKMNDKLEQVMRSPATSKDNILLLKNELRKELLNVYGNDKNIMQQLQFNSADKNKFPQIKKMLDDLHKLYIHQYNEASNRKDAIVHGLMSTEADNEKMLKLQDDYTNESLSDLINKNYHPIVELSHSLVRHYKPVYMDGERTSFIRAQFYVSRKHAFGNYYDTFVVNVIIIWLMTFVLVITLYFNVLVKMLSIMRSIFSVRIKR